jgi:hypothetical protein
VDSLLPGVPPEPAGLHRGRSRGHAEHRYGHLVALSIAFGNFRRGYTIVDCIGIWLLVDPFTNKHYMRLYTWKRVGATLTTFTPSSC